MSSYSFIDTGQFAISSTLPTEAAKIIPLNDGDYSDDDAFYLEDIISGYRTLYTKGRESLEAELETYETNGRDGTVVYNKRFPARTITVGFQLVAESSAAFRLAFNNLNKALNIQNARFIFNDEADKFFIGSPIVNTEVDPGLNSVTGEFDIYCADPFKYSADEVEVATDNYTTAEDEAVTGFSTTNSGAYKTYPRFEIQFGTDVNASSGEVGSNADCGYVMLFKPGTEYSIQAGNDLEEDEGAKVLSNISFTTGNKGSWAVSTSVKVPSNFALPSGATITAGSSGLYCSNYGSGSKKYHGAAATLALSSSLSADFTIQWQQVLACAKKTKTAKKQRGAFGVLLLDSSNNIVFGTYLTKSNKKKTKATQEFYKDGASVAAHKINNVSVSRTGKLGYTKKGAALKSTNTITREGNTIKVKLATMSAWKSFYYSSAAAITKVVFLFGQYDTASAFTDNRVLSANIVTGDYDIVNSFGSGDLLEIDTKDMSITLNNAKADDLGDVTNNWENFYLDVGANMIACQWSDWVASGYEPTITMYYRNVWI